MKRANWVTTLVGVLGMMVLGWMPARAGADQDNPAGCAGLPTHGQLKGALDAAVLAETSGLNNHMWATIVNRDGVVCAVAFSGVDRAAQWPGSRVISAQKANTANAFSLDGSSSSGGSGQAAGLALSTANLYSAVQPGGSLYGLQHSNPVDTQASYKGPSANYGTPTTPWWATRSPGSTSSGAGSLFMIHTRRSWGRWAPAAIRRAPTTTSPGGCATS